MRLEEQADLLSRAQDLRFADKTIKGEFRVWGLGSSKTLKYEQ
jgi:hypothetical protein